uniref:Uncharacterized protein n=1 Tax=Suricata suricatta TaxID=37032 RepID=A0A673TX23_SURSU
MVHPKALFKSGPKEWWWDGLGKVGWFPSLTQAPPISRRMASTSTRNEEKKGSRMSQAAASLGGGPASMGVSLSRSEEFLTRVSTELTDEALFTASYHMNPVPTKEKQTQDRGTQISKHGDPTSRTTGSRDPTIPLVPILDPSPHS